MYDGGSGGGGGGTILQRRFFYNVLQRFDLINNEHASVRICVKFLDLNCIFLQDNVQSYWDLEICSK